MERNWTTIDKSEWGEGPWQSEPDKLQFIDEATGLDCLIHRGPSGALCGYVGVPPGHPWHGRSYSDGEYDQEPRSPESVIDVHGGLTFSDGCAEGLPESEGICHIPEPGRPADVYWFGFDCAHSGDVAPAYERRLRNLRNNGLTLSERFSMGDTYKDVAYVRSEIESLARQLQAVGVAA